MGAGRASLGGLEMAISTSAISATGMLIQKIACHFHRIRNPPTTGPIAVSAPAMPKNRARARPRERRSKVTTTIAIAAGNMIAPPAPCTARNATSHASAAPPLGVRPHSADAPAKMITPSTAIRRCPAMSARRPPNANSAASVSRYALIAHCIPLEDNPRSCWIVGAAIDTIVWSMNVIATAKIIAVKIKLRDRPPAPAVLLWLIVFSSSGDVVARFARDDLREKEPTREFIVRQDR